MKHWVPRLSLVARDVRPFDAGIVGRDAHERKWACQRIYTKGRAP